MPLAGNSALRNVGISFACLAISVFILVSNRYSRGVPRDVAVASGVLNEWSVIGSGKTLRFSFEGDRRDYRVDPIYFRGAMNKKVPDEFRKGATVEISARQEELASTSGSTVAWVKSISVNGDRVLDAESVDMIAASNDRWGYAFVLLSLAALLYNLARWFSGARPNTSFERTRDR
jgi:hypothetical protein